MLRSADAPRFRLFTAYSGNAVLYLRKEYFSLLGGILQGYVDEKRLKTPDLTGRLPEVLHLTQLRPSGLKVDLHALRV